MFFLKKIYGKCIGSYKPGHDGSQTYDSTFSMAIWFKGIFKLQMHLCVIKEFEGFVNFEEFFMFYISNCLQIFIKLSLALNRGFFCKVKVKDERYDNMYMQHGII